MQNENNKVVYMIHVKPEVTPLKVQQGTLTKDGTQIVKAWEVYANTPMQWIPYHYIAYGKKLVDEKGTYNGRFEFVEAGTDGAEEMTVAYIKGCPSLDEKWQEKNGYRDPKKLSDEEQVGYERRSGEVFEFKKNDTPPLFIEYLKHHDGNGSNVWRNKRSDIYFVEVDGTQKLKVKTTDFNERKKNMEMEESIMTNEKKRELYFEIFDIDKSHTPEMQLADLLEIFSGNPTSFHTKLDKVALKIESTVNYLLKEGTISSNDNTLISNEDKKPLFNIAFKSKKPSEMAKEFATIAMADEEGYTKWIKFDNKYSKITI